MTTTVVTCYYRIASKHTHEKYDEWINNFLRNVQCNLVIFTSPDLYQYIYDKRSTIPEKTKIIPIDFVDLEIAQKYDWQKQYDMDNESRYTGRTKECYILWNSKLWFLKKAIEYNFFRTDAFIWNDIGCLRTNNKLMLQKISPIYPVYEKISKNAIDIVLIKPFTNPHQRIFINDVHFSGAQFGGHKDSILKFYDLFYQKLHEHIMQGIFVGCDQQTISSVFMENRELFNYIIPQNVWFDKWFFLWQYYS